MTNEQAINCVKRIRYYMEGGECWTDAEFIAMDMAIKALEQPEPCEDAVSRQAAIDALCKSECGWNNVECRHKDGTDFCVTCDNVKIIKSLPSIQPERIKGHWIAITSWNNTYKCSVCGRLLVNITDGKNKVAKNYPYCHCGADNRGKTE